MCAQVLLDVSQPSACCLVSFFKSVSVILQSTCCCCNPVYVRRLDPSFLSCTLSLYRYPFIYILFSSHFTSYNKPWKHNLKLLDRPSVLAFSLSFVVRSFRPFSWDLLIFCLDFLIHRIQYSLEQQGSLYLAEILSITPVHKPYIIFLYSILFLNIPYS